MSNPTPTAATPGKGLVLSVSLDGTTFTTVAAIKTLSYGSAKSDFDETTAMDSPGNFKSWLPTTIDGGEATFNGVFVGSDPGQTLLSAAFFAQQLITVKVQYPAPKGATTGFLRTFPAYVASPLNPDASFDKAVTFNSSFKVTGPYNDTPAS